MAALVKQRRVVVGAADRATPGTPPQARAPARKTPAATCRGATRCRTSPRAGPRTRSRVRACLDEALSQPSPGERRSCLAGAEEARRSARRSSSSRTPACGGARGRAAGGTDARVRAANAAVCRTRSLEVDPLAVIAHISRSSPTRARSRRRAGAPQLRDTAGPSSRSVATSKRARSRRAARRRARWPARPGLPEADPLSPSSIVRAASRRASSPPRLRRLAEYPSTAKSSRIRACGAVVIPRRGHRPRRSCAAAGGGASVAEASTASR